MNDEFLCSDTMTSTLMMEEASSLKMLLMIPILHGVRTHKIIIQGLSYKDTVPFLTLGNIKSEMTSSAHALGYEPYPQQWT